MPEFSQNCTQRQEQRARKMANRLQETDFGNIKGLSTGAIKASIDGDPTVLIRLPNSSDCALRLRYRPGMGTWSVEHAPRGIVAKSWQLDDENKVVRKVMEIGIKQYANEQFNAHPSNHPKYKVAGTKDRTVSVRTDYDFTPD